ncbi:MAG: glycosyltransferase family 39 protein [Planctomycetes bacterium]|nr:glycosyltransferase family 39 protein [Planctomycetota bacterium]
MSSSDSARDDRTDTAHGRDARTADTADTARREPRASRRKDLVWLAAIVGLALVVRVVYVLQMRSSPLFDAPQMDAKYHVDWALAFARGEDFQPGPFFRAPLYPWFLGGCFELFGPNLLVPRLVQAAFGALTVALVWAIGRRTYGTFVARLAALGAAVSWVLVFYDGELLLESLATPLGLAALWLFLVARDTGRALHFALAGLSLGLAAITRPNVLLVAVVLAGLWLVIERAHLGRTIRALAIAAFATALPILPITLYNGLVGKDWVLISSQAGVNLWIGNNPSSDGVSAIVPGTRADWWGGYHDAIALAEAAAGRELAPSEVSSHYTQRALGFWRDDPAAAFALFVRKLRLFWADWEIGNNEEPRFLARRYAPISRFLPYSFGVVGALACIGLFASRPRRAWPLVVFVAVYSLGVVAFFVCSRYRAPLVPLFLVFAARGVEWTVATARAGLWIRLLGGAAVAAGSLAISWLPPRGLATDDANGHLVVGNAELAAGRVARALEHFTAALDIDPQNWIARRQFAFALRANGDVLGATREYQSVLAAHPDDAQALGDLADLELGRGDRAAAETYALELLRRAPHDSRADYTLGRIRYAERRLDEALGHFERALEKDPQSFIAAYSLGMVRLDAGDSARALIALERALATSQAAAAPSFELDAWRRVIGLYVANGDLQTARQRLQAARARFPDAVELAALESSLR